MATNYSAGPLLGMNGLKQYFQASRTYAVKAMDDASFKVWSDEIYSLIGESGSGKSIIGRVVIRLYNPTAETVQFSGMDIPGKTSHQTERDLRRQMQMIFQDPMASLNPRETVGDIIGEGLSIRHNCQNAGEEEACVKATLRKTGLDPEYRSRYPYQLSGGQRRRVGTTRALMTNPELTIADERVSALDASIRAQIVNLMKDIREGMGTACLFIAHNLAMIEYISNRIGILHLGHLLETGFRNEIFSRSVHPYTRSLLSAIPMPSPTVEKQRVVGIYDYKTSSIDYNKRTDHLVEGTHYVRCMDQGFEKWVGAVSHTRLFSTNQPYRDKCVRK